MKLVSLAWSHLVVAVGLTFGVILATATHGAEASAETSPCDVANFADLAQQEAVSTAAGFTTRLAAPAPAVKRPASPPAPEGIDPSRAKRPLKVAASGSSFTSGLASPPAVPSPAPSANFAALGDNGTAFTPDTQGAAGPDHLMVTLTSQVRIQNRSGGEISTVSLDSFWASLGNPRVTDPRIVYDPLAQRWIFAAVANAGTNNPGLLVAVSQTSNPTGNWNRYFVDVDVTFPIFADSPNVGFNKDWIAVQADMYYRSNNEFHSSQVQVFNKANLYAGGAGLRTLISLGAENGFAHVPAVTMDTDLATLYLVSAWAGIPNGPEDFGYNRIWRITGAVNAPALVNDQVFGLADPWHDAPPSEAGFAPQLGSTNRIATGDSRVQNLVYRNGSLWGAQTVFLPVESPTPLFSAVQWWEITPGGMYQQLGRIQDESGGTFYAFPSIAVNERNAVLVGYTRFSASQYASANYSFRTDTDEFDTIRADTVLKGGEAPYRVLTSSGANPWGDRSGAVIDPNDSDLWTIQTYAASPSGGRDRWGTWWGRVSAPCNLALTMTDSPDPVAGGGQVTYSLTVTNHLRAKVTGVRIVDVLPAGFQFVSATASQGSCTFSNGVVTCFIDTLADRAKASATIVAQALAVNAVTNIATAVASGPDTDLSDNTVGVVTFVNAAGDLGVRIVDTPDPIFVNSNLTYSVIVSNSGPATATGVTLTNILPGAATFQSVQSSQGSCSRLGTTITCGLGSLTVGGAATVTIRVTPTSLGTLTNRASVRGTLPDFNQANNTAVAETRVGNPPTISDITDRTIFEESSTGDIPFTVSDGQTPAASLVVAASSSNPTLVPNGNIFLGGSGFSRTVSVSPAFNQFGTCTITVNVTDGEGLTSSDTFLLTVTGVNDAPALGALPPLTLLEDSGLQTVPVTSITAGPAESQNLILSASSSNPGVIPHPTVNYVSPMATGSLVFTPVANANGSALITVIVTDDGGTANGGRNSSTNTFQVTVTGVNDMPTLASIPNPSSIPEDAGPQTVNLTGLSAGSGETQPLTVTAFSSNTNVVASLQVAYTSPGNTGTLTYRPVTNASGTATISVVARDNGGTANGGVDAVTNSFIVTVLPVNDAPTLTPIPAPAPMMENAGLQTINLTGISAGGGETQTVTLSASSSNTGLVPHPTVTYASPANTGSLRFTPVPGASGTATVSIVLMDDGGTANGGINALTNTVVFTVIVVNDPPTLAPIPNPPTLLEDSPTQTVPLSGISAGPSETQALTVTAFSSNPAVVSHPTVSYTSPASTGSLTFTPAANNFGNVTISVVVTDNGGTANGGRNAVTNTFTVMLTPVNDAPTLNPLSDRSIMEDAGLQTVPLTGVSSGPNETQSLTITASSSNPALVPNPAVNYSSGSSTGNLTFLSATNASGSATITVILRDNGGTANGGLDARTNTFVVTILSANDRPTLNPIPNPAPIPEDSGEQIINLAGITAGDNEVQFLTLTATSSHPALIPHPAVSYSSPAKTGVLRYAPVSNAHGTAVVSVVVRDDGGTANGGIDAFTNTFTVIVNSENDPPVLSLVADQVTAEDVPVTVPVTVSDVETPPDALILMASSSNEEVVMGGGISFSGTGTNRSVTITPLRDQSGSTFIVLTLLDGGGASTESFFELTVNPLNDPPTISEIRDQVINRNTSSAQLPFSISDAESPVESLQVSVASSNQALVPNANLFLEGAGGSRQLRIVPVTDAAGTTTVTITVGDGMTNGVRSFLVKVNLGPMLAAIGPQTTSEDTPAPVSFTVADPDTALAALQFSGRSSQTNLLPNENIVFNVSGTNPVVTLTPRTNASGQATLTLTVTDDGGLSADVSFDLTVTPVNDPPTLAPLADLVLNPTAGPTVVQLSGIGPGAADETGTVSIAASSSDLSVVQAATVNYSPPASTGSLTLSLAPNAHGQARITLTLNDGQPQNNLTTREFTVRVNALPTVSAVPDQTFDEDRIYPAIAFTVGDVETPPASLNVSVKSSNTSLVPAPAGLVLGGSGGDRTLTIRPATNQFGLSTVTLSVLDGDGNSNSHSFLLIVNPVNDPPEISDIVNQTVPEDGVSSAISFTLRDTESLSAELIVSGASSNPRLLPVSGIGFGGKASIRTFTLTPARNQTGTATVTVTVTDPQGASTSDTFVLTVSPSNDLPTISSIPNLTIEEDTRSGPLSFVVGDVETPAGSLTVTATSSNLALVPNSNVTLGGSGADRTVTITPLTNQFGTTLITLTVQDAAGGTVSSMFQLQVAPVNDPPTLASAGNLILSEDAGLQMVNLTGIGSGAANENDNLILSVLSSNPALLLNPAVIYTSPSNTGMLRFTPAGNLSGSALVTVTVDDGRGSNNLVSMSFTVTVNGLNDGPTISDISNASTPEDVPLTLSFQVNDPDTSLLSLSLSGTSSNPNLVPNTNIVFSGFGNNRSVTVIPLPDQSGTATITATVSDGSFSLSDTFTVTVTPVNDPPTLSPLTDQVVTTGSSELTLPLAGITRGAPNESSGTLSVTALSSSSSLVSIRSVTYSSGSTMGSLRIRPASVTGVATITVTVTDNDPGATPSTTTFSRDFLVYVKTSANALPTISDLPDRSIIEDTTTGDIAFTVSDSQTAANLLTLSGASSDTNLVPNANIVFGGSGNARTVRITPAMDRFGSATISVTVVDNAFAASRDTFVLTVLSTNDPPRISDLGSLVVSEDTPTGFIPITLSDPDTPLANVTFIATSSNFGLVPAANILAGGAGSSRALLITPATNQTGTATITVTAGDGLASSNKTFMLTVNAVNDPPVISGIPDQTINEDGSTGSFGFTLSDPDTPVGNLTPSGASSNPTLVPQANIVFGVSGSNRTVNVTPATNQFGTATITVTINDGTGMTASDTFQVRVNPVNDPPTLAALGNLNLNQNAPQQTVSLSGIGPGAANEIQTLFVTASSSNPDVVPHPAVNYASPGTAGTLTFTPVPHTNGSATITVMVNDGQAQNNLFSRTFTVLVDALPTISDLPSMTFFEDALISPISFTVGDRESPGNLTVTASSSNQGLVPNANLAVSGVGASRSLTLTPLTNQFGNATITLTVRDASGNTASDTFLLAIVPVNDAPTLMPLAALPLAPNAGPQTVNLTGISSGAPNETQTLALTAHSSNPGIIPHPTVSYASPGAAGSLHFTPVPDALGTATIMVTLLDHGDTVGGGQNKLTRAFNVTVDPNQPIAAPVLRITRDGSNVILFWHTNGVGYSLQMREGTPPEPWVMAPGMPVLVGDHYRVTNSALGSIRLYRLVKPLGPALQIERSLNNQLLISWRADSVRNYLLESRDNPGSAAGAWSPVTNTPVAVGDRRVVTLGPSSDCKFYRLRSGP